MMIVEVLLTFLNMMGQMESCKKLEVNSIFSDFGYSVSILNDWALIGAPKDTSNGQGRGAAYLYNFDGNHWNQIHQLRASDGESSDQFGDAVSLSENWALVGNPADNYNGSYSGSVYVFSFDTNNWTQEQKLIGFDIVSGDSFGSVSQDDMMVRLPVQLMMMIL
ncbi:MAG: FG-GAP repeat protein [Gammaproteobacteria bacterium]